jgi:hypothetical protein
MGIAANVFGQMGWATSGTADTPISFLSESLRKVGANTSDDGIRGTRSEASERIRSSIYTVAGTILMEPNCTELVDIIKWCGFSQSSTTYSLTETLTSRDVTIDRIAKVFTYAGCYVNRAVFSSSEGTPLRVSLDLIGQTETVANAATFPSLTHSLAAPYMHHDAVCSLVSSARQFKSATVTFDNMLIAAFNNSQSAQNITPGGRKVMVNMVTPYSSSETALYAQAVAGTAATITYTQGATSLLFSFATLQVPDNSPVLTNKNGETVLELNGQARTSSTTKECIITFDSTP